MTKERSGAARRDYLVKGGAVITVDPKLGTLPKADVLIRDGTIIEVGASLAPDTTEVIDATNMIVMPGFVDSHTHMWSTLGRNFVSDNEFGYYPAKWATAELYQAEDFYNSLMLGFAELAGGGITTVHNWSHNNRSPHHVDAELRAHKDSMLRARYSIGHIDRLPPNIVNTFDDLDRVQTEWFANPSRLDCLVHLGINLRGMVQSEAAVFHEEMQFVLRRRLPVCIHASQTRPNVDDAADYERRGYLGPQFLFSHYLAATDSDRAAMARTHTPLTFSTYSELRLGEHGDPRAALLKARAAGILTTLSSDATSIAPMNMFENMRATWNMTIPWKASETEALPPLGFYDVIEMATINGARALGLGDITGSITPGKRADIILIRTDDINVAPLANIETTIVQSATPANVDTVMVDGRILKRYGRLKHHDVQGIIERAISSANRIRSAAGGVLKPISESMENPISRKTCQQIVRNIPVHRSDIERQNGNENSYLWENRPSLAALTISYFLDVFSSVRSAAASTCFSVKKNYGFTVRLRTEQ
jgi:5-methylthioadenosine/S-adenosylhomocysteine deaminase